MIWVGYTEWDGTQRVRLAADKVFESLAEHLSDTHDVQEAFDWLIRHGIDLEGTRIVGLEELVEGVRAALRARYGEFDLETAIARLREELGEIVDLERATLEDADPRTPRNSSAYWKASTTSDLSRNLRDAWVSCSMVPARWSTEKPSIS